ncbi:hypothetical protein Micbo1qcDRAFT_177708 [Microdochium bolleyi]|uniref:Fungal lipase-type domain-containing protein n=1 Tax=Microdochium bolleyi TaxID=196109 RepID=A0A136IUR4_9PEZI|nr:hypothetical protein Micbo1qcDRAFT_177708 [Microdochium bolleyi]
MSPSKVSNKLDNATNAMFKIVAENIITAYNAHKYMTNGEAYDKFQSNVPNNKDTALDQLSQDAVKAIEKFNPNLSKIHPIFVAEPTIFGATAQASRTDEQLVLALLKAGSNDGAVPQLPVYGLGDDGHYINVLVYRGTATKYEGYCDIKGWGDNVSCMLPTNESATKQSQYGKVQNSLFGFYQNGTVFDSLANSTHLAVNMVKRAEPSLAWVSGGHSLGGAMMTIAMLDLYAGKVLKPDTVITTNYGTLMIGNGDFKDSYNLTSENNTITVLNICDFVPTFSGLLAPADNVEVYQQVGMRVTFVWQKGEVWANHSMVNVYWQMVSEYFVLIKPMPTRVAHNADIKSVYRERDKLATERVRRETDNELDLASDTIETIQESLQIMTNERNNLKSDKNRVSGDLADVTAQNDSLAKTLNQAQKGLESVTQEKTGLQSQLTSAKETSYKLEQGKGGLQSQVNDITGKLTTI